MAFDRSEGSPIDKNIAAAWTRNYREAAPTGSQGYFFSRELLNRLLNQNGCTGIRFYRDLRDGGVQQLLAVGADQEENDQLDSTHHVVDDARNCPPCCSRPSIMNSYLPRPFLYRV